MGCKFSKIYSLCQAEGRGGRAAVSKVLSMNFDECCNALLMQGLDSHPSELQGGLFGRLCGNVNGGDFLEIFSQLTEAGVTSLKPLEEQLEQIHKDVLAAMDDGGGLIELLLPDDDQPLPDRLDALARWCRGFLAGLGLSGLSGDTKLAPDITEAMRDIAEIALVDADTDESEDDEVSLAELIEFVRVASSLIQVELARMMSVPEKRKH